MKNSKEVYQDNSLEINEIILNNQDKKLHEVANILNDYGYKTKRGVDWTKSSVNHHSINILKLQPRNSAKKNIESPLDITIDKLEYSNSKQQEEDIDAEILPNYDITDIVTINNDGVFLTDSIKIASTFKTTHRYILKIIRELDCSNEFRKKNFLLSSYNSLQNKEIPMYVLTRDGFSLVAMGLNTENAIEFKELYINQFNQMEQALKEQYSKPIQKELSAMELMAITLKGFQEQDEKILFQVKKESELLKDSFNKVFENQDKKTMDRFKELEEKISKLPKDEKIVYTQEPIRFSSEGLKDTKDTFKSKGDDVIRLKKQIQSLIFKYSELKGNGVKNAYNEVYNVMNLTDSFYKKYKEIKEKINTDLPYIDYLISENKGDDMLNSIKFLIANYSF